MPQGRNKNADTFSLLKQTIFTLRFVLTLPALRYSLWSGKAQALRENEKILRVPLRQGDFLLVQFPPRAGVQEQGKVMGYDIYGKKPTAPEGEYYRSNIWYWPPFVAMCRQLAHRESKGCKGWEVNDGHGLDAKCALRLANRLDALLIDGTIARYIVNCGEPPTTDHQANALKLMQALVKGAGGGVVSAPGMASPAVTEEDVRDFVAFLKTCGGFRIY